MPNRYSFDAADRITLRGVPHRWLATKHGVHAFANADDLRIVQTRTDDALDEEASREDYAYDPQFYDAGRTLARINAGNVSIDLWPAAERDAALVTLAWVTEFLRLEEDGRATRSDAGMARAIGLISPMMAERAAAAAARRAVSFELILCRRPPTPKALRTAVVRFERGGHSILAIRKGSFRQGNRSCRLDPDVLLLVNKFAWTYASETRPTKAYCHLNLRAAIDAENKARKGVGLEALKAPSRRFFDAYVSRLNAFEVHAARFGKDAAQRKFAMLGQRFEIDEWQVQLMTVMADLGVLPSLTRNQRRRLERLRVHMSVVLDAASLCAMGLSFARKDGTDNTLEALRMACVDKTAIARSVGAKSDWEMACTPEIVASDAGPSFGESFRTAVVSIGAIPLTLPAGRPELRGRQERLLSTINKQALAGLTGRTFENVVAKGDYDPEERASIATAALLDLITLWFVDIYNNTPHAGLGGRTPANAWRSPDVGCGPRLKPSRAVMRNVFGLDLQRITGRHGVRVLDLNYTSERLQAHRRAVGDVLLPVKLDQHDIGAVSVRIGTQWITCRCVQPGYDGVSVETWRQSRLDLRRRYATEAKVSEAIVLEAVRTMAAQTKVAIASFDLGSDRPSARTIERWEREVGIAFLPPPDPDAPSDVIPDADLFDAVIPTAGADGIAAGSTNFRNPDDEYDAGIHATDPDGAEMPAAGNGEADDRAGLEDHRDRGDDAGTTYRNPDDQDPEDDDDDA